MNEWMPLAGVCPDDAIRFDSCNGSTTYGIRNNNNGDAIDTKGGVFFPLEKKRSDVQYKNNNNYNNGDCLPLTHTTEQVRTTQVVST